MAIATVITAGFGNGIFTGSIPLVVTFGYDLGNLWSTISPSETTIWTPIVPAEATTWATISPAESTVWTEILS